MDSEHSRPRSKLKLGFLLGIAFYLAIGFAITSDGSYAYIYAEYARNNPVSADWESHDVIYEVVSAHYQDNADPRHVNVDGVGTTVYDTPRELYLCIYGKRHGADEPEHYQIRMPMHVARAGDTDRYSLVSNGYFLAAQYVDDVCQETFRDDVVEITPQSVGTIVRDNQFGVASGSDSRLDLNAEIRARGFHIPERYPEDGLPYVFYYSLENAQHRVPAVPPDHRAILDWPVENKHMYIGFYDGSNRRWRIAGIYHETGNHRPRGLKPVLLKVADAAIAPLYVGAGLMMLLFGIRVG